MSLRIVLIAAGIVGLLFGLLFLLGADAAIQSLNAGDATVPARLFARSLGAAIISISIINLLAARDPGSPAVMAVAIGNVVIHALSIAVDFTETYTRNPGVWVGLTVHVVFIVAFGYCLANRSKATGRG